MAQLTIVDGDDQIIEGLRALEGEIKNEFDRFKKKAAAGPVDLASTVEDLFSLVASLAAQTTLAHADHYEWGADVDEQLEELGGVESILLPADATRLKTLLLNLSQNLREPTDAEDDVPKILKAEVETALGAIDEMTANDDEEPDENEDE